MDFIIKMIKNVLIALYQTFGASVFVAVLSMFFYEYALKHGFKESVKGWIENFKKRKDFRRVFFLAFYTSMLLFRTVFCRSMWIYPLENVIGVWGLYNSEGKLYTENIENIILFVPFVFLLFWAFEKKLFKNGIPKFSDILIKSFAVGLVFSGSIEFCQLIFKLGTFQLSDLFFNTLGAVCGGIAYYAVCKFKEKKSTL